VNTTAAIALGIWTVLSAGSTPLWFPARSPARRPLVARTAVLLAIVTVLIAGTGVVALLAATAPPLVGRWTWLSHVVAVIAAFACGGPLTSCLLSLADASSRPGTPRVQRTILHGGSWIGALERLTVAVSILSGFSAGIAVIVAIKGLGRYPDLKAGQGSGAAERFIIGTFASLGWAAACAGVGLLLV
jgi:hypothetical protein